MRTFIIATATTAAAAVFSLPALTQQRQGTVSIPEFSGIWAHFTWPDAEPPLSGPGPVTNTSRRDGYGLVGDYTNPILKPKAAEAVRKQGELELRGGPSSTPSNQCWPGGVPFVFYNIGMLVLQQADRITFLYSNDHEVRHVRMNQPHAMPVAPSWYGDSVAHYEGDTLVIDTIGIKIGPFAMVDMYGTPHSEALHVVERYRLLDYAAAKEAQERGQRGLSRLGRDPGFVNDPGYNGKGLQLDFTVEDAVVFTRPWSASISYRRPIGEWPEIVCAENPQGYFRGKRTAVPTADKPDF